METERHLRKWSSQTTWCGLGVCFSPLSVNLVGTEQTEGCSLNSPSDSGRNFSHPRRRCLNLLKSFAAWSFLLFFLTFEKKCPFLILYEIYRMSSHAAFFITKPPRHSHVPSYWPTWLCGIIINHSLDLTNKFGSSLAIDLAFDYISISNKNNVIIFSDILS